MDHAPDSTRREGCAWSSRPVGLWCAFVVNVVAEYAQAPVLESPPRYLVGQAPGEQVEPVGRMFAALVPFVVLDFDEDAEADTARVAHGATVRGPVPGRGKRPGRFTPSAGRATPVGGLAVAAPADEGLGDGGAVQRCPLQL